MNSLSFYGTVMSIAMVQQLEYFDKEIWKMSEEVLNHANELSCKLDKIALVFNPIDIP